MLVEGDSAHDFARGIKRFEDERQRFAPEQMMEYTQQFRWDYVVDPLVEEGYKVA